ncbi:MAG: hypothetical protein OXC81_03205, partial [Betaproteobacteria bacterium]|nr:hypothetical protein [Betaproteobacteria bacterium]
PEGGRPHYLRNSSGREVDLIFERPGGQIWAVEIKAGSNSSISEDFSRLVKHLRPERAFLVHGGMFKVPSPAAISIVSLPEMMNELLAQDRSRQQPSSPAGDLPASRELVQVIEASRRGSRSLNINRKRFIAALLGAADRAIATAAERDWICSRDELPTWLEGETAAAPEGAAAALWQQALVDALEGIGDRVAAGGSRNKFGRLCCYDALVHVTATLLANKCYRAVGKLLGGDFYIDNEMTDSLFFAVQPADFYAKPQSELLPDRFVLTDTQASRVGLIEADLLMLLNGVVLTGKTSKQRSWWPWIFVHTEIRPPLALFRRAQSKTGMNNLLDCLNLNRSAETLRRLRQDADLCTQRLADEHPASIAKADANRALNIDNWPAE